MLKISKDGVSVIAVLDRRRAKKSGVFPVKIEVVYNRIQKYYPTGVDLPASEWKRISYSKRMPDCHADIITQFNQISAEVEALLEKGAFSFETLEARLGKPVDKTLNAALESMMDKFQAEGRINSYYRCRTTLKNVERFAGKEILFSKLSVSWFNAFESFLKKENKAMTTICIYMKTLRCVMNDAAAAGLVKESMFPFGRGKYIIPKGSSRSLALSYDHIRKIVAYKGTASRERYRDLWLFSYLCNGINFRDMLFLKYKNIIDGEICFLRSKTARAYGGSKIIRAVITPEMMDILRRWGNPYDGNPETLLFDYAEGATDMLSISNTVRKVISMCNNALKKIAEELGIPPFTTYSARHSFATVLLRQGVDLTFISESLGHSSLLVTEHYLGGSDRLDRMRNARLLTNF